MAEATGHGGRVVDLSGAEIRGDLEDRNPPIFLPRQPAASPLLALDIGGTYIPTYGDATSIPRACLPACLLTERRWGFLALVW
jgi:hypothetical protein